MGREIGVGGAAADALKVSVVVPTRNEVGNIPVLVDRITAVADAGVDEILFVDDSSDRTPDVIRRVAQRSQVAVRLLHRPRHERAGGLGGAVLEGFRAAQHDWVCVMDADLQHPPDLLPELIRVASEKDCDLVIASRRLADGGDAGLGAFRRIGSDGATAMAKSLFPRKLTSVTDPLGGFFLVDKTSIPLDSLRPDGFKILLEILVRSPDLSIAEVPYRFGERHSEESNASIREALRYMRLVAKLRLAPNARPPRRPQGYYYSIHGIIDVCSDVALPELAKFRTEPHAKRPDVTVRIGDPVAPVDGHSVFYSESLRNLGFAVRIAKAEATDIVASSLVGWSPHVLYTNVVEPVLRWGFVERGYALVHAACVEIDDLAYFVTAKTDTGKTTTILRLLERGEYSFLSDDLSLIDSSGTVLTYPKPMTVSRHTLDALRTAQLTTRQSATLPIQSRLHSKSGRQIGFELAKTRLPAATMNAVVQKLIPPPKYHVEQLVPAASSTLAATVAALFVIARGEDQKRALTDTEAIELLIENSADAYGFPPYYDIEPFLRTHWREDLAVTERGIIAAAFASCPAWYIGSRTMDWADHIASFIEEERRSAKDQPARTTGDDERRDGLDIDLTDKEAPRIILDEAPSRRASKER